MGLNRRPGKSQRGLSQSTTKRSSYRRVGHSNSFEAVSTHLTSSRQASRVELAAVRRQAALHTLDAGEHATAMEMDYHHTSADYGDDNHLHVAPGEEGYDFSHAGGEFSELGEMNDHLSQSWGRRRCQDDRTRRDRINNQNDAWEGQMDALVLAYLEWQADGESNGPAIGAVIHVEELDLFYRTQKTYHMRDGDIYANAVLLRNGCLGSSPLFPTVSFSLRTLEVYRQTHRVCPRLSVQAEVRKLCHLHLVPYRPALTKQFSNAFNIYLDILQLVGARLAKALHHDTKDWRMKNACPACHHVLEGEPPLRFRMQCQMDGNNSLKRVDEAVRHGHSTKDSRQPRTDYWISPEDVNVFKDEVKARAPAKGKKKAAGPKSEGADIPDGIENDYEGITDVDPEAAVAICIERWRNASPEERKRMWAMYSETGIFIVGCRHGIVLTICDMIKSGELAKYPLACVNRLLKVYGKNIQCGFDIGCAFSITLANSSLGKLAQELGFHSVVPAFHGHAHNRGCQVDHLPMYIKGSGRSEFEGCERTFERSNGLAPGSRHATRFLRQLMIEVHYAFWDQDKYAELSTFLYNHYREALEIIVTLTAELAILNPKLGLETTDYENFLAEERTYLQGLKKEPEEDIQRFEYVAALELVESTRAFEVVAREDYSMLMITPAIQGQASKELVKATRAIVSLQRKSSSAEDLAAAMENKLNIATRWVATDPAYIAVISERGERKYKKALDELERLVVQRLFELAKLNIAGTGYKLRTQISKALQTRSQAIRTALAHYNDCARKVIPRREELTYKQIVEYAFIGDFALLRNSRQDIREKLWSQPAVREATTKFFQLQRAHEEVIRLNVEIRRLRTAIHDESIDTAKCITELTTTDPNLAHELCRHWQLKSSVNALHLRRLDIIEALPGYTGTRGIGHRIGRPRMEEGVPVAAEDCTHGVADFNAHVHSVVDEVVRDDDGGQSDDEDVVQELDKVVEYLSLLALAD